MPKIINLCITKWKVLNKDQHTISYGNAWYSQNSLKALHISLWIAVLLAGMFKSGFMKVAQPIDQLYSPGASQDPQATVRLLASVVKVLRWWLILPIPLRIKYIWPLGVWDNGGDMGICFTLPCFQVVFGHRHKSGVPWCPIYFWVRIKSLINT